MEMGYILLVVIAAAALGGFFVWRSSTKKINKGDETSLVESSAENNISDAQPATLEVALKKTKDSWFDKIQNLFVGKNILEISDLEKLEEILYTADMGSKTIQRLIAAVELRIRMEGASGFNAIIDALKGEMLAILKSVPGKNIPTSQMGTYVILVVGVNGAGKTTTIGKLAKIFAENGKKVLVAAGDTFRAAASAQLKTWTDRAQVEIFNPQNTNGSSVSDPSAVAFMACEVAVAKNCDILIIDTAGRLHTQKNLMEEMKKIKRVVSQKILGAPHEVTIVLDANSGQNALQQAREFNMALGISSAILTKLDGTGKGGIAVSLVEELKVPISWIGIGEGINDLKPFEAKSFVQGILPQ